MWFYLMSLSTESYGVTIQMEPLLPIAWYHLFFNILQNEILLLVFFGGGGGDFWHSWELKVWLSVINP